MPTCKVSSESESIACMKMSVATSPSAHHSSHVKGEMTHVATSFLEKFNQELCNPNNFFVPWLEKLEQRTSVKRTYLVYGFVAFLALYLIIGYGAEFICNGIGFLYPAYQSLKALESSSKEDDTKWLIYWVVFAFFSLLEFFSDVLLSWFPPYYLAKLVFLIWLILPIQNNGSSVVYNRFIRPVFLRNQGQIAEAVGSAFEAVSGSVQSIKKYANKNKEN